MAFRKVARTEHLGTLTVDSAGHTKTARAAAPTDKSAQVDPQTSYYLDGSAKVDVRGILKRVASDYAISDNPSDYIFEVIRANTTSVFNDNHDGFGRDELLRFDPRLKTAVYLTYREKPHHVNHRTDNPKRARGVILDAHYNAESTPLEHCPGCNTRTAERHNRDKSGIYCKKCGTVTNDEFVEILVAIDKKKDPLFAKAVQDGQLRFGSMGCTCAETICNVCDNVARSRSEFCKHIASHKGTLWTKAAGGDWKQITPAQAEREFKKRKRAFHNRDFVAMRADDGFEVRKAAEWCQGVEYDEYSRVHMPADPKAERIELLKAAANTTAGLDDLQAETTQLVAAARMRDRKRSQHRSASQEKTAMMFHVIRIDGDDTDMYAAETVEQAMEMAKPPEGAQLEVTTIDAESAAEAREKALAEGDFQPMHDQHGAHELEGDVVVNITEGGPGGEPIVETEQVPDQDTGPTSIEDFTEETLDESEAPGGEDEEFSPEELGVMPAGASKEANMQQSSYADWKVQVTPRGNAQVVSPRGPVLLIQPKKAMKTADAKRAFGIDIMKALTSHGLFKTAEKFDAAFHAKFASVVDYAEDDMKEFSDKDTKADVASGGENDMGMGAERGQHESDTRNDADSDMQEKRTPEVKMTPEGGEADHELAPDGMPDSATENQDSDMREKRREFNMGSDDALQNAVNDHTEKLAELTVGSWFKSPEGKLARVASMNKKAQTFTLIDANTLSPSEVKASDLLDQWKQLDQAPQDNTKRMAAFEERLKRWAKTEIEKARRAAVSEVFRAVRIAATRRAKGLEESPLKEAMASELVNDKVVGHDARTRAPLEYTAMSDELAIHLVEAAYHEAAQNEVDTLLKSAAALLKMDSKYLASAEEDLKKVSHRVPPVTAASMVDDLDREAEALRRSASVGNLELSSHPDGEEAPMRKQRTASVNGNADKIRSALGGTRAASRIQLRR